MQANQKSEAIREALRAHSFCSVSPGTDSNETTQSHDENNNRDVNHNSSQNDLDGRTPAPFQPRRLDNESSAEDSATADDSARNCGASSAFNEEALFEDACERPSHDAVSLPLPVCSDSHSCHHSHCNGWLCKLLIIAGAGNATKLLYHWKCFRRRRDSRSTHMRGAGTCEECERSSHCSTDPGPGGKSCKPR